MSACAAEIDDVREKLRFKEEQLKPLRKAKEDQNCSRPDICPLFSDTPSMMCSWSVTACRACGDRHALCSTTCARSCA